MKQVITIICIVIMSSSFRPGVGSGSLTCKSESGRTIFKADFEDHVPTYRNAELSIDGKTLTFSYEDEGHEIIDLSAGVFTLYLKSTRNKDHKFLKFWAIPKSFKTIVDERDHQKYEFRAKIYATEPRTDKEFNTPEIEVSCIYEYEL